MLPVLTVEEMRSADAATRVRVPEAVLVRRAGTAVARSAIRLLGGAYGRRVLVLAGKGNNGADGRVAAAVLSRRGARVTVVDAVSSPPALPDQDLVIDAALGTGFRGSYEAPEVSPGTSILAVDIPSGVDGDTGEAPGRPLPALRTVTFAALKRGLLLGDGRRLAGGVEVADIGVDVGRSRVAMVGDADAGALLPRRPFEAHKWMTAVTIVAGSPGMEGAGALCARGAMRAGAGMVRLAVPGTEDGRAGPWPVEAVRLALPLHGWADRVLEESARCRALVVGPGLGRGEATQAELRKVLDRVEIPAVVDADALFAVSGRRWPVGTGGGRLVLTPHDGEYERLAGTAPGPDRIAAARFLAERAGATVLLKGSLTAVAAPGAVGLADLLPAPGAVGSPSLLPAPNWELEVLLAAAGTPRLATAGTGDVLGGVIGAFMARGLQPLLAAALGAHVHGRAAGLGHGEGLIAGDLPELVATWLSAPW